ncbi:MAG: ABC transporter permease subunit [Chloroflexi bacterium]|nr:ABC transporter permease subunit [Chloroflexota bacterium]
MIAILRKELADYFTSVRFIVLFLLVLLASFGGLYAAYQGIRQAIFESGAIAGRSFVFLRLFTSSGELIPSFIAFINLFIPIIGIALGFDAINSERSGGTLSRILSQPVYRDSVINGKFLAGIATLTIMVSTTVLLVSGYGLRMIGVPPTAEEIIRLFIYLVLTIIFGAFWMGLAMLFSVIFRRIAASLLVAIAVWLLFSFFMPILMPAVANALAPVSSTSTQAALIRNAELTQTLMRFSPVTLFMEATTVLLLPAVRSLGIITMSQAAHMLPNPLSLGQSLIIIWPHLVTLISLGLICFAVSYVLFMKQEIRAT